ncbi:MULTISPECIES: hypothetical protein [unclassified Cryobacterium]|uniref:hypothetical protein n=2 Tax=Cryobacterium TaxID=69578 RepID=UPI002AB3C42B|nr:MULTISPECIES: hypothetical protein [unclassified Cryobacterium]MDY7529951.1 hypothetical protein [Cryobacterium sp. 10C2]MDY7557914.1 hypothetical protein [Cryobacterium sp. 10C3]MEB0004585.1 hypothetical protein [Cryobacterium sp. RTC2.1]MEB0287824.1 hypothetical protein [Cryobacterium sp. 10S3]MEB0290947.1 hypothetical protein [Cryobacterium sp. 10C2]
MGRSPAPTRMSRPTRTGERREAGIDITDGDLDRVRMLARWYCMTSVQIAAMENPVRSWHPDVARGNEDTAAGLQAFLEAKAGRVYRRLLKVAAIKNGVSDGPLVVQTPIEYRQRVWSATAFGARIADTPWRSIGPVSWFNAHHALLAADIAIQFSGIVPLPLLSQRELTTGHFANGDDLPLYFNSKYDGKEGQVSKVPDLAILAKDGRSYIAIEIECDLNRALGTYRSKLEAYGRDEKVSAVWYVCEKPRTANRVLTAAADYPGSNVRVMGVRDLDLGLREADMRYLNETDRDLAKAKTALLRTDVQKAI